MWHFVSWLAAKSSLAWDDLSWQAGTPTVLRSAMIRPSVSDQRFSQEGKHGLAPAYQPPSASEPDRDVPISATIFQRTPAML